MIRHTLLFYCIVFCFSIKGLNGQNSPYPSFPTAQEIMTHFDSYYYLPPSYQSGSNAIMLEKRVDGYYFCIKDFPNLEILEHHHIWSAKSNTYLPLPFSAKETGDKYVATRWDFFPPQECDRNFYFGYDNYTYDVIAELEGKASTTQSDILTRSLARAYTNSAINLFHTLSSSYQMPTFDIPNSRNKLTPAQVDTFLYYQNKALAHYSHLASINPEFETPVGEVYTKYCNEVMSGYLLLKIYQNEAVARDLLLPNLYQGYLREVATKTLEACPPDAILFTYGDNDTYPLLYLQVQEGLRTDVQIINLSLLQLPYYLDYLEEKRGIDLAMSKNVMYDETGVVYFLQSDEPLSIKTFITTIDDQLSTFGTKSGGFWQLPVNYDAVHRSGVLSENPTTLDSIMYFEWSQKSYYLLRRNIGVLDIIQNNNWEKPVCFSTGIAQNDFGGFTKYFHQRGLLFYLSPEPFLNSSTIFNQFDVEENIDLLLQHYRYSDTCQMLTSTTNQYQVDLLLTTNLVEELNETDPSRAIQIIDRFFENYPDQRFPFTRDISKFVPHLLKFGEQKRALNIALTVIKRLEEKKVTEGLSNADLSSIERMKDLANEWNLEKLTKALEDL